MESMLDPLVLILLAAILAASAAALYFALSGSRSRAVAERALGERDAARLERERLERAVEELRERSASEAAALRTRLEGEQHARVTAETRCKELQERAEETIQFVEQTRRQLEGTYAQLSQTALKGAVEQLLDVVKPHLDGNRDNIVSTVDQKKSEIENLLTPVRKMLDDYQAQLHRSEKERVEAFSGLTETIRQMNETSASAQREASRLATALRAPQVRGSWGENTLRNCVELAGMSSFCDFEWQYSIEGEDNRRLRPDMIVRLPENRVIAVDSKSPIDAYLAAAEESDEKRRRDFLTQHAANLRRHIDSLSRKDYQEYVQKSLGKSLSFTILFISGEHFLSSAMITDAGIFEYAASKNIVLASPTILVPLLKALNSGWKAEELEENAQKSIELAAELYSRFLKVFEHIQGVGKSLNQAVSRYNDAMRSIDSRLVPAARQIEERIDARRTMEETQKIDRLALEAAKVEVLESLSRLASESDDEETRDEVP